jgi:hypothetical protein
VLYSLAADLVLVVHLLFILAVVFGALTWLWLRWAPWVHLPMAAWGAYVELFGRLCPLTTLENHLLQATGEGGYQGSFVAHYLLAVLYPAGLTRNTQLLLGAGVVAANVVFYAWVWHRRRQRSVRAGASGR